MATIVEFEVSHGQRQSGPSIRNHVARQIARHEARDVSTASGSRNGLQISPPCERVAWQAGPRISIKEKGYLRTWMFLASASRMRAGQIAKIARGVLVTET